MSSDAVKEMLRKRGLLVEDAWDDEDAPDTPQNTQVQATHEHNESGHSSSPVNVRSERETNEEEVTGHESASAHTDGTVRETPTGTNAPHAQEDVQVTDQAIKRKETQADPVKELLRQRGLLVEGAWDEDGEQNAPRNVQDEVKLDDHKERISQEVPRMLEESHLQAAGQEQTPQVNQQSSERFEEETPKLSHAKNAARVDTPSVGNPREKAQLEGVSTERKETQGDSVKELLRKRGLLVEDAWDDEEAKECVPQNVHNEDKMDERLSQERNKLPEESLVQQGRQEQSPQVHQQSSERVEEPPTLGHRSGEAPIDKPLSADSIEKAQVERDSSERKETQGDPVKDLLRKRGLLVEDAWDDEDVKESAPGTVHGEIDVNEQWANERFEEEIPKRGHVSSEACVDKPSPGPCEEVSTEHGLPLERRQEGEDVPSQRQQRGEPLSKYIDMLGAASSMEVRTAFYDLTIESKTKLNACFDSHAIHQDADLPLNDSVKGNEVLTESQNNYELELDLDETLKAEEAVPAQSSSECEPSEDAKLDRGGQNKKVETNAIYEMSESGEIARYTSEGSLFDTLGERRRPQDTVKLSSTGGLRSTRGRSVAQRTLARSYGSLPMAEDSGVLKRPVFLTNLSHVRSLPKIKFGEKRPSSFILTNENPGPGSYNLAEPGRTSKFREHVTPSFGGGASRFGYDDHPGKVKPAPGQYGIPKNPVQEMQRKVAFSMEARECKRHNYEVKDPDPGPGAYEVRSTMGRGIGVTAKGKIPKIYNASKAFPGPGAYEPKHDGLSKFTSAEKIGVGTSIRTNWADLHCCRTPGPGAYNNELYGELGRSSNKYSFKVRHRKPSSFDPYVSPGPGSYNSHGTCFGY